MAKVTQQLGLSQSAINQTIVAQETDLDSSAIAREVRPARPAQAL
jgi:hypothetical protein